MAPWLNDYIDALAIVALVVLTRALYWRWKLRRRRKAAEYALTHKTWRGK